MGRSSYCFKIITCGSDSADNQDLDASESNYTSDKRGWSFRKRSARHQVLSNTVISEAPSSGNKESLESASLNFQQLHPNSTVPEKISILQCTDEKSLLPTPVNSKVSENIIAENVISTENETKVDVILEESFALIIQTAIRGFLAQRELLKLKNVVKLQAAVRGHLVRRHAVGSLRCIHAIVKMQALVRARRARMSLEGSYTEERPSGKRGNEDYSSKTLVKGNSATKSDATNTSIENLLSNSFARQLLESTPKTKPIHVKCDPLKPNSAWKWLERWMSVSSPDTVQSQKPEQQEREKEETPQVETQTPSEVSFKSADLKSDIKESTLTLENEDNLITYDAENFKFQAYHPTSSSVGENLEEPKHEKIVSSEAREPLPEICSLPNQTMESDSNSQMELNSFPCNPEIESEQPKHSMKRFASEQLETEGKKFLFGSRKASNPAFIAAQSKFEVLSSTANSGRSISSSYQDVGVESNMDTVSSDIDIVFRTKDINIAENSSPHNSRVHVGGSDCGTELSITSTLDSPDRSEVGATEIYEHDAKISEEEIHNPNSKKNLDVEAKDASPIPLSSLSYSSDRPAKLDDVNIESLNSGPAVKFQQIEQKPEKSASDLQRKVETGTGRQAYRSSPEASPRSHITVPESQGTPSSQVSVKAKRNKTEKSGSNQKRKSLSTDQKSPPYPNHDSGARSSNEQLPKDLKNGKRRNSFGSKPDHVDQEPRDSNSSNSLPHFMQATESARAKVQANNSPRSSPDVQDRDIYIKKRHSLPGANGRQASPRIQRSMSQALQGAKGNGTHPQERKWQR